MKDKLKYTFVYNFALGICSFLLCYAPKLVPIGLILIFVIVLFGLINRKAIFQLPNKLLIAFILFYIAYVIGAIYTDNAPLARNYLEYKLSFILIPLLFFVRPKGIIDLFSVAVGLILGVFVTAITSFVNGIQCYNKIDYFLECFTSSYLTKEHPTYFAVYLTLAIALSWYGWLKDFRYFKIQFVLFFNIIAISMLALGLSLSGILFALLTTTFLVLLFIYRKWGKIASLSAFLAAPLLLFILFFSVPSLKSDMLSSANSVESFFNDPEQFLEFDGTHNGDDVRLIMWTVTTKEFLEHPFGVGTGNVDYYLSKRLRSYHQMELAKMDDTKQIMFNPHNQYLQTGLEVGIIGLLILLFIIVYGFYYGIKSRNWLLILVTANLGFNCLFESMLQRQSGIVFFTFWIIILSLSHNSKNIKEVE
jgi:O-antigen ligase